jgi:hypothetical protein
VFEDAEIGLMGALDAVVHNMFNLGKHAFAESLEREGMQASQHFSVGLCGRT